MLSLSYLRAKRLDKKVSKEENETTLMKMPLETHSLQPDGFLDHLDCIG